MKIGGVAMEILKGTVQEQGYPPVPDVYYGKVDEKTIYYFIPDGKMANGNIIVSTNLKEAVGHAPHTSLGYIDPNGNVLIPCEHKTIKQVGNKEDNILLAEKNIPTSESVTAIIKSMSNPANQQAIEENGKKIKDQMIQAMGMSGDFIFDNQCSEAALYTMGGINVSNGYYSFISELNSNYYFATNVPGQQILTFNPSMIAQQEQQQPEQEAMPNIDIPIQQQVENEGVLNQQGIDMPPQVEPEAKEQEPQTTAIETLEQTNTPIVSNSEAEERLDQIMGFANTGLNDSSQESAETNREIEDQSQEPGKKEAEAGEDEMTAEGEDKEEMEAEAGEDEMTAEGEDKEEMEAEAGEDEMTAEGEDKEEMEAEADEDEITAESKEPGEIKTKEDEEQSKVIDFPNIYKLNDEDISTPVIRDATQTIINIVGENRKLRQELDKRDGKISILESNLEILNEDSRAKDEENKSLRQELAKEREEKALYKNQAAESNRESIKLRGALERQVDISKEKDRQVKELLGQVAGLSNLNNAVMEANALVQPAENNSGDNLIYGDFTYLGNAKSKSKVA